MFAVFRGSSELQGEWAALPPAACRSDTSCWHQKSIWTWSDLARVLPAGAELKLCSHPSRSASGFTTVQDLIPVENTHHICSTTFQTSPPRPHSTPVITGNALSLIIGAKQRHLLMVFLTESVLQLSSQVKQPREFSITTL